MGDFQARFCERLEVKFLLSTRLLNVMNYLQRADRLDYLLERIENGTAENRRQLAA